MSSVVIGSVEALREVDHPGAERRVLRALVVVGPVSFGVRFGSAAVGAVSPPSPVHAVVALARPRATANTAIAEARADRDIRCECATRVARHVSSPLPDASTVVAMTVTDTPLSADAQKVSDLVDDLLEQYPPKSTDAA